MVKSAVHAQQQVTNGLKILLGKEATTQVQASWRFLNNANVTIKELYEPLVSHLEQEIQLQCDKYVLALADWSHLDYKKHTSKKELKSENRKDTCMKIGYDYQGAIAASDRTGEPIGILDHNLKTADNFYSTYDDKIDMNLTHLDELRIRAKCMNDTLQTDKRIVNVIDRESDSIAFMRGLDEDNQLFLLRGKNNSKVNYHDKETNETISIKQGDLAKKLPLGKKVKSIKYRKKNVTIFANECDISISRDATKMIVQSDGKKKLQKTKGKTLKLRFVVERLVNNKNEIVAEWLLLSNVFDKDIDATSLANWYYYRWKIESYFKLLKSSGFNLEEWQQKEPLALFKRLLIVSNACILVWKIANDNSTQAKKIRDFLIKLSGKQIQRGIDFTYPALLSGLENYLTALDLLRQFSVEEIFKMRDELVDIIGLEI
jgi:hypothetical protein